MHQIKSPSPKNGPEDRAMQHFRDAKSEEMRAVVAAIKNGTFVGREVPAKFLEKWYEKTKKEKQEMENFWNSVKIERNARIAVILEKAWEKFKGKRQEVLNPNCNLPKRNIAPVFIGSHRYSKYLDLKEFSYEAFVNSLTASIKNIDDENIVRLSKIIRVGEILERFGFRFQISEQEHRA